MIDVSDGDNWLRLSIGAGGKLNLGGNNFASNIAAFAFVSQGGGEAGKFYVDGAEAIQGSGGLSGFVPEPTTLAILAGGFPFLLLRSRRSS